MSSFYQIAHCQTINGGQFEQLLCLNNSRMCLLDQLL